MTDKTKDDFEIDISELMDEDGNPIISNGADLDDEQFLNEALERADRYEANVEVRDALNDKSRY